MAVNLSFLGKVVSSAPISLKVAVPSGAGGVAAAIVALIHQYAPGVKLPSDTTIMILLTALMGVIGYLVPHSGTSSKSVPAAPDPPPAAPPGG